MTEVTRLLSAIEQGDPQAAELLLPLVYEELRKLAARKLAHEVPGQTLQPTALVHEAYLRLVGHGEAETRWDNRAHFFAAAAEAMRRILIENARRKQTEKRGGAAARIDIDPDRLAAPEAEPRDELLALDEALQMLGRPEPRLVRLVELRYFAGLTLREAAEVLGISPRTADADWAYARAWLLAELSPPEP
jgi:RNA polymerase sigma factor (TIGR02999 family)